MIEYVNINGEKINPLAKPKVPKPKNEGPAEYHKGFAVEGYPPGFLAEKEKEANDALSEWNAQTEARKAERLRSGDRAPKPWSLESFLVKNKPKRVRTKPYELLEAATICGQLAVKEGWQFVRVTELKKAKQ